MELNKLNAGSERTLRDERCVEILINEGVAFDAHIPTRRIAVFDDAFAGVSLLFFNRAVKTLLSASKPRLAAEFLLARFRVRGDFDSELLTETLSRLSGCGYWSERNELLLTHSLIYSPKDLKRFLPIFLDLLDINRAERAIAALRELETAEVFIPFLVSLAIAKYNDDAAIEILQSDSNVVNRLIEQPELCKWLYLLAVRRMEFLDTLIERIVVNQLDENVAMINARHLIKTISALQVEGRLKSFLLTWSFEPSREILIVDPEFCRSYLFVCDKLGVKTRLLEKIYVDCGGVFCDAEKRAIEFKREFYEEGLEFAFKRYYTLPTVGCKGPYLEIPLIVYGEEYLRSLRNYFIESATTSQEFMDLPLNYKCTISICTTPDFVEKIKDILKPLVEVGFHVDFPESFVVPLKNIVHYRMVFHLWCMYRVELQGGVLVVICPDSLFGHGFKRLIENCPPGGGAGGVLVRVSWAEMERSRQAGELGVILRSRSRNSLLAEKSCTDWRHFCCDLSFKNISKNYRSVIDNGYQYNSWQGVTTIVKPSRGLTERMLHLSCYRYSNVYSDHFAQTLDHELVGHLSNLGLLYMPDGADEFVFLELAKDAGYSQLWKFQCPTGYPENPPFGRIFS